MFPEHHQISMYVRMISETLFHISLQLYCYYSFKFRVKYDAQKNVGKKLARVLNAIINNQWK